MINFMIENLPRIIELKEQGQSKKATIETLKSENPEMPIISIETFTQYRRVLIAYHETIANKLSNDEEVKRLTLENSNLRQELSMANIAITNISQKETKGKDILRVSGWNITKFRGYYRGFRSIGGKLRSIYLGKSLEGAEEKVAAKELTFTESVIAPPAN